MDDVLDRAAHEHGLIEVHLQFEALRRGFLQLRQQIAHGIDHRERGGVRVLENRHIAGALTIDAGDVGLGGVAIADLGDVAEQHRDAFAHADRQSLETVRRVAGWN